MFTGIIQDVGQLSRVYPRGEGATLDIRTQLNTQDWLLGESVAVDGVCLTVTSVAGSMFSVDCSPETLRVTKLGRLQVGALLHLERALRLGDHLGGHLVSGHVDGLGVVQSIKPEGNALIVAVELPASLMRYTIVKGSITLDGVSLTINTIEHHTLTVAIIPHTQQCTHIPQYRPGTPIHVEVDLIGKYIERLTQPWHNANHPVSTIDEEFLKKHGFA